MDSDLRNRADATVNHPSVLMLSHYFEQRRGGVEIVAAALAGELATRGVGIVWLATGEGADVRRDEYRRGSLPASSLIEKLVGLPYPLLFPSAWPAIAQAAKRADVIVAHDALYMTSVAGYFAARLYRKKFLVVQHIGHVPYRSALLRRAMALANRLVAVPLLRHADQVVFISRVAMRHFAGIRLRRSPALLFNGVDTEVFRPAICKQEIDDARRSCALAPDIPVALFVGRFVEKKGLHVLEKVAAARGDLLFAFAGQGSIDPAGWGLPNVRVYRSLSGRTLANLYRASDVLLLPSVGEGFPLVVQEALACGLPIVCGSEISRADPRVARYVRTVEVDLGDPVRTAASVSRELDGIRSRPLTGAERQARFDFACSAYSWSKTGESYVALLRDLCTEPECFCH